ncbi:uncharacterized protein LOC124449281 [Xenia sp. Carnegie-2017]|uniref:uncharacterized protein LOC124449281 n=1 Tax=Xenia sp. Carnegie-2017 TaxID=2897299 RepID=UPI001F04B75D|nr:uncharacterized protein LOC124449281 [Xenia sp. Carnegie-2017]
MAVRSDRDKELSFYRIPALKSNASKILQDLHKERRSLWLRRIRRADIDDSKCTYLRVCSLHFATGKPSALTDQTNPDWAPSQNLGHTYVEKVDVDRYARISERNEKRKRSESIETVLSAVTQSTLTNHLVDEEHGATSASLSESESNNKYSQTELSLDKITAMKSEINRLTQENLELKNKISDVTLDEKSFLNDDEKVLFYTGLPNWKILSATLELIWLIDLETSTRELYQEFSYK